MKRTLIYLFALLATVTLFTACGGGDEPESKQTFTATVNNRAVDGEDFVFSQGSAQIELNYTNMTMHLTTDYKDIHGQSHTLNTGEMKLTGKSVAVYAFTSMNATGYIDLSTGMLYCVIETGDGYNVYCTTQLVWPYVTTTITGEDGRTYSHEQSGYIIAIDSKGENAVMQITDYVADAGGAVQEAVLQYTGLAVTPTATGYVITADEAECTQTSYYNLSDLKINITGNGMMIDGSFKIKNNTYSMAGNLFGDIAQ